MKIVQIALGTETNSAARVVALTDDGRLFVTQLTYEIVVSGKTPKWIEIQRPNEHQTPQT